MAEVALTEIASGLRFPEGPVWLPDGDVLVTELQGRCITRVRPDGTKETVATPGGSPNGAAIGPDGALYVCNSGGWSFHEVMGLTLPVGQQPDDYTGGRIERVDLSTGDVSVLYADCDGIELVGPNDLVFDADGGFYFTDHGKDRGRTRTHGAVFHARADGSSIREVVYPLESPNGVGLSPAGDLLYVVETYTGRVWSWAVSGPGELAPALSLAAHGGTLVCGLPGLQLFDSLAIDGDGNVVVATLAAGVVSVISPSGDVVDQYGVGDPLVTNVCFGGDDLRTAFVTLSGTGRLVSMPWPRPGLALAH